MTDPAVPDDALRPKHPPRPAQTPCASAPALGGMFHLGLGVPEDASAHMARTEALLAAIVASSEDAIASKTLEGIVTSWNQGAERLFGYSSEEMVGQSILRIIPRELHAEEDHILSELRRGNRIERYETERLHKDGRRLHISLTISPIRDVSGTVIGAAKVAHDVTELRERQAQLKQIAADRELLLQSERAARAEAERLGRLKDEFLATLSHELRTPLNAIQGWTQILRHHNASPQDFQRGLEAIDRNVRAQTQIVNDLLDMSRIISGQVLIEVRPMSLQEVIHGALDSVRPSADSRGIRIQTMLDSQLGPVRGDPNRMQQVLWNLLTNAIKFTPKGGRISVALERIDSHVEITIEDTGIGIEPEFLPFVFDRFRQADAGIGRRYGGLGVGLSIVKSLVELHGGSVRVRSPGRNQGSTFAVILPVYQVRIEEGDRVRSMRSDPLETIALPRLDHTRALVVDDDLEGCAIMARMLEGRGAQVRCVGSGQEALELLSQERFDILLSDIGMPDMDGYDFIQRVRRLPQQQAHSIPAIAITAYARPEDRQRALLSGFQIHLSKPIEAQELIAAIAAFRNLRH
jgi:PAS domain S-box-containing protein